MCTRCKSCTMFHVVQRVRRPSPRARHASEGTRPQAGRVGGLFRTMQDEPTQMQMQAGGWGGGQGYSPFCVSCSRVSFLWFVCCHHVDGGPVVQDKMRTADCRESCFRCLLLVSSSLVPWCLRCLLSPLLVRACVCFCLGSLQLRQSPCLPGGDCRGCTQREPQMATHMLRSLERVSQGWGGKRQHSKACDMYTVHAWQSASGSPLNTGLSSNDTERYFSSSCCCCCCCCCCFLNGLLSQLNRPSIPSNLEVLSTASVLVSISPLQFLPFPLPTPSLLFLHDALSLSSSSGCPLT